jgi:glycerophosphoryl diester phosphodiesterase
MAPRPPATHPYLDWPGPIAFAHRGGASTNPENTMSAFRHAVELGYTYLETDVHATRDGVLVAFHDPDLSRTCGLSGTINSMPWREVAAARVGGREPIPRLEELLEEFPNARLNIDCKADSAFDALVATLHRTNCLDRVCVGSFNDLRLRRLRAALGPRLLTSFGPAQVAALRAGRRVPGGGSIAQIPLRLGMVNVLPRRIHGVAVATASLVARAHRLGYHVHVWTVDDVDDMRSLLDIGVDGIMTDRPQVLKDLLVERGEWC